MATITARADTIYGKMSLKIEGTDKIESVSTGDDWLDDWVWHNIKTNRYSMANNYKPEPDSMLQAYAFCLSICNWDDISVDGDIGEIPYEPGVIY